MRMEQFFEGENRMEEKEARKLGFELMEIVEVVYVATIDSDGFPQTRAMMNLRNKKQYGALAKVFEEQREDFLVYLTTSASSAKVQQIKANSVASVYYCNPSQIHGLMLGGNMEVVTDEEIKRQIWQDGWEIYYPGGVDGPEYTILQLLPAFAKGWSEEGPFGFKLK
jgi:general stress protein 26